MLLGVVQREIEMADLAPGCSTGVMTLRSTVFKQRRELVLEG